MTYLRERLVCAVAMSIERITGSFHRCVLHPAQKCRAQQHDIENNVSKYLSVADAEVELGNQQKLVNKVREANLIPEDYIVMISEHCETEDKDNVLSMCTAKGFTGTFDNEDNVAYQLQRPKFEYTLGEYIYAVEDNYDRRDPAMGRALCPFIRCLDCITRAGEDGLGGLAVTDFDNLMNVAMFKSQDKVTFKLFDLDKLDTVYPDGKNIPEGETYVTRRSWINTKYASYLFSQLVSPVIDGVVFKDGDNVATLVSAIESKCEELESQASATSRPMREELKSESESAPAPKRKGSNQASRPKRRSTTPRR